MKRSGFLKNAAILTATSLLLRSLGMVFRVYLSGQLGAEGMGLYQLIVSVYALLSTFATSGICTAVTRLCAEEVACGREGAAVRVLHRAVWLSVALGLVSAAVAFFGAPPIARWWLRDERAVPALRALSMSLPFMGISSCLRGYFLALRRVAIPSRTQTFEQLVRIGAVMLLLPRLLPRGTAAACAGVLVGDTVAEAAACLLLCVCAQRTLHRAQRREEPAPSGILRRIAQIALPITGGRYLHTALRTAENLLAPACLTRFTGSRQEALASFGSLKGMALPLLFFPSSFLSALSTLLLPEVSSAAALGQQQRVCRTVEKTVRVTLLASMLLGVIFYGYADDIGQALYHDAQVGLYLRVLAPLVPVMYLESMVDGILKGLGQQVASLRYCVADSLLRIVLIVALVPFLGMRGFLLIMLISNLLTSLLNVRRLLRVTGVPLHTGRWIVLPALAAVTALLVGRGVTALLPALPLWQAAAGAAVTGALYLLLARLLGCLDRSLLSAA